MPDRLGSLRGPSARQGQFLALLPPVEFLALSSSAPLVYWLGCLCSLVALFRAELLLRLVVWFLQLWGRLPSQQIVLPHRAALYIPQEEMLNAY